MKLPCLVNLFFIPLFAVHVIACKKNTVAESNFIDEESTTLHFTSNGVTLEGTLEIPAATSPAPLLIFVHGSGPRTRSDYQSYVNRFKPQGFAVFRYDKRGVGTSGGVYSGVGVANGKTVLPQFGEDAHAAIQMLKHHPRLDSTRIVLIGASQAGWIIPVAATLSYNVYTVMIAGPTVTVGEEIFYSDLAENTTLSNEEVARRYALFSGEKGFDPAPFIQKMGQPGLWILGGKDRGIPSQQSVTILQNIIQSQNKPFTIHWFPDADHGMINRSTGQVEDFLSVVEEWFKRNHILS